MTVFRRFRECWLLSGAVVTTYTLHLAANAWGAGGPEFNLGAPTKRKPRQCGRLSPYMCSTRRSKNSQCS